MFSKVNGSYCFFRNYVKGECLLTMSMNECMVRDVAVNPGNWRQISVTTDTGVCLYTVEQSDVKYNALSK